MSLILSGTDGLSDVDGSAATPAIRGTDANTGIFFGTDIIGFSEGGVEAARINADSQFVAAAGTAALPVITTTGDTNTGIFFPAADTIAFSEGGAEVIRIDSSGNLGVGTISPSVPLDVNRSSATSGLMLNLQNTSTGSFIQFAQPGVANLLFGCPNADAFVWKTFGSGTYPERARITSGGDLYVGTTTGTIGTGNFGVKVTQDGGIFASRNEDGSVVVDYFGGNAGAFRLLGNGNAQNTNNSYGAISDIKLKENIVDASPKLADLMQVKVRNYNLIGDTTKQIGVVAQELETVFPAMIDETTDKDTEGNDLGTTTKSVKYSVFVPMLIKAMQEQQALITQLTARITALEGA
jgi:hypothetical protein